jgi:heat shock protein HtpX
MLVIAVVIAGVISFFGELVFRGTFRTGGYSGGDSSDRKGGAAIALLFALAIVIVAWVLSIVIRFSLSRTREYLADAGAVELTKNPDAMIMALRKIEGRGELTRATASVMEMCVDNPHSGFVDLFSTHPSIDRRVEALVRAAGGRDPGPIPALPPPELPETVPALEEAAQITVEGPWVRKPIPNHNRLEPWHWGPWGPRRW